MYCWKNRYLMQFWNLAWFITNYFNLLGNCTMLSATVMHIKRSDDSNYICHRHRQCRRQRFSGAFAGAGGKGRPAKPAKNGENITYNCALNCNKKGDWGPGLRVLIDWGLITLYTYTITINYLFSSPLLGGRRPPPSPPPSGERGGESYAERGICT